MAFMHNNLPVSECIKEDLNPNAITMNDLIDNYSLQPPSAILTDFPPNQIIHHQDEDMLQ